MTSSIPFMMESKPVSATKTCPLALIKHDILTPCSICVMVALNCDLKAFLKVGVNMPELCEKKLCTGCQACENRCPFGAISMKEDEEGFFYPDINKDLCTECGLCEKTCPVINDPVFVKLNEPEVYACWSNDDEIRDKSSSGGVFSLIAREVLKNGGVVFGAVFDESFGVYHTYIEDYKQIDILRRSKYVQSYIGNSFKETEAFLKSGRKVFYVGTPCQIAGLVGYLKKTYENLITCGFVCYGVPSPKVWKAYLQYRRGSKKISRISFRDKMNNGWRQYNMLMDFEDGTRYIKKANDDAYFIGFGRNLFSRLSCFNCKFRFDNTKADITLADFWGIEKLEGIEVKEDKGVSMVLINTIKGEEWINRISQYMFIQKRTFDEAAKSNPKLVSSAKLPKNRESFFKDLNSQVQFDKIIRRYMRNTGLKANLKKMIKSILGDELIKKFIE